MADTIFLDYNSTTPLLPEVRQAMDDCWAMGPLNPSSQHQFGRQARIACENAKEEIARLLGATSAERVLLTSGGTEANNLAIFGLLGGRDAAPAHLIISAIEHPSINAAADYLAGRGWDVDRLRVDSSGVVRVRDLPHLMRPETRLVSVMLGNNETGVLQPIGQLAKICRDADVPLHTDAAQAAGKVAVDFRELGVASLTIVGHKMHGPKGIGALVVRADAPLVGDLLGGNQQEGFRPGTEPVALAVGLACALKLWDTHREEWVSRLERLRDRLETGLKSAWPATHIIGGMAPRLPHTSNIAFKGLDRQALFMALDQAGLACSTGSACSSGASELSPVHVAMGYPIELAEGALRLSLGIPTTEAEIDEAIRRILASVSRMATHQSS